MPPFRLPPVQATALAHPALKATATAAPLRFGLERGSRRARFRRRAAAHLAGRRGQDDFGLRHLANWSPSGEKGTRVALRLILVVLLGSLRAPNQLRLAPSVTGPELRGAVIWDPLGNGLTRSAERKAYGGRGLRPNQTGEIPIRGRLSFHAGSVTQKGTPCRDRG